MENSLVWKTEDEGTLFISCKWLELQFMVSRYGEEEAELNLLEILPKAELEFLWNFWERTGSRRREAARSRLVKIYFSDVWDGIACAFSKLWEEGFEEVLIVEKKGSAMEEVMAGASTTCYIYSEYMMQKTLQPENGAVGQKNNPLHQIREMLEDKLETVVSEEDKKLLYEKLEEADGLFSSDDGSASPAALEGEQTNLIFTKDGEEETVRNEADTFFCRLQPYQNGYYLCEIEVEEAKRNQGIATKCLINLLDKLAADNVQNVYLQVGSYNEPALHLYQKLGFDVLEELCFYGAAQEE